ncbi:hypothetical protein IW262DRAFT_1483470, partial [Armillaria fumosa]
MDRMNIYRSHRCRIVVCMLVSMYQMFITSSGLHDEVSAKDLNRGLASPAVVFVILCPYGVDILTVSFVWSLGHYVFIGNGWNFWTVFVVLVNSSSPFTGA